MESVLLVINIIILALIIGAGFYFIQSKNKKKLEQEILDKSEELTKKDQLDIKFLKEIVMRVGFLET